MSAQIVAGNWKMNGDLAETQQLLREIRNKYTPSQSSVRLVVAPPFPNLYKAFEILKDCPIEVAAQNMHQAERGAFTGEVSAPMLKAVGVSSVILGHSERRKYFQETPALLTQKVDTALQHDLDIFFCVGEQLPDREAGDHFKVVENQLSESLFHLKKTDWEQLILAYEPVWAIGTGKTATAEQAEEMHAFIRQTIAKNFGADIANEVSILYGGSVKPHNAAALFAQPNVNGGLIGGASLKADDFLRIAAAF